MAKRLRAKHDKIILKPVDKEEIHGGIIIPDTGKEKSNLYEVIDVGPGRVNEFSPTMARIPMECVVGEIISVKKAVVTIVEIDGVEFGICREVELEAGYTDDETEEKQ